MLKFVDLFIRVLDEQLKKLELRWDRLDERLANFEQKSNGWLDMMDKKFHRWLHTIDNKFNRWLNPIDRKSYGLKGYLYQMFAKMRQGLRGQFVGIRKFARKRCHPLPMKKQNSRKGILRFITFKNRI